MRLLERLKETLSQQNSTNSTTAHVPPSDAYSLLANERRRHIIEYLVTHEDDVVPLRDIADYLAEEMDDDRHACYVSVLQQHAPHMERAGVVTHDNQAQTLQVHDSLHRLCAAHKTFIDSLD
jgi:hypothetical protein